MSKDLSKRTSVMVGLIAAAAIAVTSAAGLALAAGGADPLPVRDNVVHSVPIDTTPGATTLDASTSAAAVNLDTSAPAAVPVLTTDAPVPVMTQAPAARAADVPNQAAPVATPAADVPADDTPTMNPNDPFAHGPTAAPGYTAPPTQPVENPTPTPDPDR